MRLLSGVDPQVSDQVMFEQEAPCTCGAMMWLLPHVDLVVRNKPGSVAKALPTFRVNEWLLLGVDFFMGAQKRLSGEALPTFWTAVGLLDSIMTTLISHHDLRACMDSLLFRFLHFWFWFSAGSGRVSFFQILGNWLFYFKHQDPADSL